MATINVSETNGPALDWLVAQCESGLAWSPKSFTYHHHLGRMNFSTDWSQGGPIIDSQRICIFVRNDVWPDHQRWSARPNTPDGDNEFGPTPLIAAMRCYVVSVLGDTVEVPEEILS